MTLPVSPSTGEASRLEFAADDPAAFLPMPGSIVRQRGDPPPVVTFVQVAPEHVCSIDTIEAALGREETKR